MNFADSYFHVLGATKNSFRMREILLQCAQARKLLAGGHDSGRLEQNWAGEVSRTLNYVFYGVNISDTPSRRKYLNNYKNFSYLFM